MLKGKVSKILLFVVMSFCAFPMFAQNEAYNALYVAAPYWLHRSGRGHAERWDIPHPGAAASHFGESPDGALCLAYSENFHEFHKD